LPLCIARRNIIDSKTYPRKIPPLPASDAEAREAVWQAARRAAGACRPVAGTGSGIEIKSAGQTYTWSGIV